MKERWRTLGLALAALACFYVLFFPGARPAIEQTPPLSTEAGPDGYLGAWRWLEAERIPLASLRQRYQRLDSAEFTPAATGNLLITTLPHRLPLQLAEWTALESWVQRGNTLLIMAALDDTPQWALGSNPVTMKSLQRMIHIEFRVTHDDVPLSQLLGSQSIHFVPQGAHPLLRDIRSLEAQTAFPASRWQARSVDNSLPLAIAVRAQTQQGVLWLKPSGHGQIVLCAFASPFSNRELDHADNGRLLSNIIAWSRSASGRVIFDDAHQGLVDFYDATAFFGDPRLHKTLWWILLAWLVFVLGPQRMRGQQSEWHSIDETALLQAGGRFFSAAVVPLDAQRALLANFFNGLRRRLGMPESGEPVWDWLDAQAAVSAEQRRELHDLYARVCAEQRVALTRLHNLLSTLQGQLM